MFFQIFLIAERSAIKFKNQTLNLCNLLIKSSLYTTSHNKFTWPVPYDHLNRV